MEILQNSILKLIIRQGSDSDRRAIILDSGELGYTVDNHRVFVGDGFLSGGNVVGNLFRGSAPTITNVSLWPSIIGDTAFATDSRKLYALQTGVGNILENWLQIGGVYIPGDNQIHISSDNQITLAPISSNYISADAVASPLTISSGRIHLNSLSAGIFSHDSVNAPLTINSGRISLPALSANTISTDALSSPLIISNGRVSLLPLSAGHVSQNAVESPLYISNGKISLSTVPVNKLPDKYMIFSDGVDAYIDGSSYHNIPINPLSSNTVVITSRQIHATYYGLSGQILLYSRNTTAERLSTGHYRFIYNFNIDHPNYIPIVQILGLESLDYHPRVISTTLSSCDVKIMNSIGSSKDVNIYLLINY